MSVLDFDKRIIIRIRPSDYNRAKEIVKSDPERFSNLSHYFRSAILKANRENSKGGQ